MVDHIEFQWQLEVIYKELVPETYYHSLGHDGGEDRILKRLTLSSTKKESLVK